MSDISELMARDPLQLSSQDLDAIILKLRQSRNQYKLGQRSAGNPKKTTAAAKKTVTAIDLEALGLLPAKQINLEELGLIPPTTGETKGEAL